MTKGRSGNKARDSKAKAGVMVSNQMGHSKEQTHIGKESYGCVFSQQKTK